MISIIIPCYNCENTLAEAVASCFTQEFADFEIVMIDDGSTDGTRELMKALAETHPEIRTLFHEKNRGGGAARNTGIKAAKGDLIYCLDSDNIFADNTLGRMAEFLREKKLDGAGFYERRFFTGSGIQNYEPRYSRLPDRPLRFEDLFNENDILLDNFLYTKASYLKTSGYPEHHGFDTQAFEIAYLAAGNSVQICPDTAFYHRQAQKGRKSYFEREYEKGLFSVNTFLSLEPALPLLSNELIDLCVTFDLLQKNRFGAKRNLLDAIRELSKAGKPLLLLGETRSPKAQAFIEASQDLQAGKYAEAAALIKACEKSYGSMTPLLSFMMIRIETGMEGVPARKREEESAKRLSDRGMLPSRKMRRLPPLVSRTYSLAKKLNPKAPMETIRKISGKIRRHATSLFLSSFAEKDSRKAFSAAYGRARKLFIEKIASYRYQEYLMPEWAENTRSMEKYFAEGFSFSFLNNRIIKKTMFLSTPEAWKKIQKSFIAEFFGKDEAKRLLKERSLGKPILDDGEYVSSGNTIHHAYHIAKFCSETGTDPKSLKTIVELGGGYGNFARLVREMNPGVTYAIVDIPVFSYIQMAYLQTIFGEDAVRLIDDGSKIIPGKINLIPIDERTVPKLPQMFPPVDLFVSTWALSESNEKTQAMVRDFRYFGAQRLLLAYQKANTGFAFAEKIRDLHADHAETFSAETEYLKDNFYLFAERK